MGLWTRGEADLMAAQANQKIAGAHFDQQAFSNPKWALSLKPGQVKGTTDEHVQTVQNQVRSQQEDGQKNLEMGYKKARADAMQYQSDYIKQNGHPDMARLETDAQHKTIRSEEH